MIARLVSFLVWALVAAAAVAWGLKLTGRDTPVPAQASLAVSSAVAGGDLSRVLGQPAAAAPVAASAPAATDARFQLVGVMAPRPGQNQGLALISIDGKPARTTRLGQEVEPGLVLATVTHRRVELASQGKATLALELPPLAEAQRGRPGEAAGVNAPGAVPVGGPGFGGPGGPGGPGGAGGAGGAGGRAVGPGGSAAMGAPGNGSPMGGVVAGQNSPTALPPTMGLSAPIVPQPPQGGGGGAPVGPAVDARGASTR